MSFSKKYLANINQTSRIIQLFEGFGFQVLSMDQYQAIVYDLIHVLSGSPGKKRGRKPSRSASVVADRIILSKRGPGRPPKNKRGRPRIKKEEGLGVKRGPGRPPKKKRGRPAKIVLSTPTQSE